MNKEKFIEDQINKKIGNLEKKILNIRGNEYIMLFDSKSELVPIAYYIDIGRLFVNMDYFFCHFHIFSIFSSIIWIIFSSFNICL